MKYIKKFDSVADMTAALASSTISVLGMAMNGNTPVINNKEVIPTIPNDEVWYTSSDGNIIEVDTSSFEPLTVVSNTYNGGKGVIKLSGELTTFGWGFAYINTLTSITMPNSITSIGEYAFTSCTGLTSLTIPSGVTTIGQEAFSYCTGLTSVTIPSSVTSISNSAFSGCSGLTSIEIPSSVTSISNSAFSGCSGLTSITVDSNNSVYDSRNNCNAVIQTSNNTLIIGCKNTVIPSSVTTIGSQAFHDCVSLTSITIPSSVTSIGSWAFYGCSGLTSITIPSTVTTIGSQAFYNVPNIIYNGSATGSPWGAKAVNGCIDGDFVYTDNTKTNLVAYVGNGGSIIIPDTVTTLDRFIFKDVTVTSIVFGNNVSTIPAYMFGSKQNLTSLTINNGIIGEYAFYNTGLTSLIFGNGNISIGKGAFVYCTGLTSITIPNNVTSISSWAFGGCSGLSSITCLGSTPLTLTEGEFDETNDCPIYVPAASVDAYKSAWSSYASRIQAIQAN